MKSNFECANVDCNYTTGREDNLKLKDLKEMVKGHGGYVETYGTMCPKCHQNSLVYVAE